MTKLAAYLPAMEELNPEDFADHITHPLSKLTDTKNLMKEIA